MAGTETLWLLLIGLAIGVIAYVTSSGHVIFLPLLVVIPLASLGADSRRAAEAGRRGDAPPRLFAPTVMGT
jgi:hypothetical protein